VQARKPEDEKLAGTYGGIKKFPPYRKKFLTKAQKYDRIKSQKEKKRR
jgi:hypothetical protein